MEKKNKNRSTYIILSVIALVITLGTLVFALLPFALWQIFPYSELNVWAIDKTVPYTNYREHSGFFWVLKNEKVSNPTTKRLYDDTSDYFGFHPYADGEWRGVALPTNAPKPDLIYIIDTYGVYKDDYMSKKVGGGISEKLYGALEAEEIKTITDNLGDGNTFIAEFNTAASPTALSDRMTMGDLIGIHWKGWVGKYFEDLAEGNEVPEWVMTSYTAQTKKKWNFFGRGYVLLSDTKQVIVLEAQKDVGPRGLEFSFRTPWDEKFKSLKPVPFRSWFEWIQPEDELETVADYNFDLTESGKAKLSAYNIPARFPAVLYNDNVHYRSWYFAGNFADISVLKTPYKIWGISWLKRLLADNTVDNNAYFYWKAYVPLMQSIVADAKKAKKTSVAAVEKPRAVDVPVRAFEDSFEIRDKKGEWNKFFVRGVNLGMAEPGKFFTEFPMDVDTYLRWLDLMAEMNANTVRIYTLPPPEFYKALYLHNTRHPDKTLYLLQEIWPEEHPERGDYLAVKYRNQFAKEINYGLDAVYGRAQIPQRKGRAWGIYTTDVSQWLLGWLIGRELESEEVMETDARNPNAKYTGKFVSAGDKATPTEVWLAESLDLVASIESSRYGYLHPLAIVSWPTLDPVEHESEWDTETGKKNKGNDRASITIEHMEMTQAMEAGIFGAYHIYPNYPDFINNELAYDSYLDDQGRFRYGGYLREFMQHHKRYPALVAEFGLANGAGIAHYSPDGFHHGGIDETAAGEGILRMMETIRKEGYAGGVIFEWMDEWVKKTWTTEMFMIPYDRHVLWHNVVDPEQNYGLMANEVLPFSLNEARYSGTGALSFLKVTADAAYLNIEINLAGEPLFDNQEILLGIDSIGRAAGQNRWPVGNLKTVSGLEFLVRISSQDKAELLVAPSYNSALFRFRSLPADDGKFERLRMKVNGEVTTKNGRFIPALWFDASPLRRGAFDEAGSLWYIEGKSIYLRLPWTWLNVTDPSSLRVLDDSRENYYNPTRDSLHTAVTDGFVFDLLLWNKAKGSVEGRISGDPASPYRWRPWEETPPYREKLKKSYYIVRDAWAAEAAAGAKIGK